MLRHSTGTCASVEEQERRGAQLSYDVYPLRTVSLPFINYTYIVVDSRTRQGMLVDPAWDIQIITGKLKELQVKVQGILLTHSHQDHVHLASELTEIYGCAVYMSAIEVDDYGFRCKNLIKVYDRERLRFGETTVTCIWTPGHTSGSMCYFLRECVFTGDTLFIEGCGECQFRGSSAEQMFDSIQKIKASVTPDMRVFPGHSFGEPPGASFSHLYDRNIYVQLESRKHFVDFRMRPNQSQAYHFQ
ncbi:MBL fold metallo-hydrolase [Paenibacillus cellulositrophicus]|uniref:MBL fold metallo-hydrolase n=1 Tax=Paenibacillus cellulositrophicus TaxID=562959 RepID=UPI0012677E98|nr:MBL fold metallo-hydrolase [Paenibacillus cellulositrophicus]